MAARKKSYQERLRIYEEEKRYIYLTSKDHQEYERRIKKLIRELEI